MDGAIDEFWKYVAQNVSKLDPNALKKDSETIFNFVGENERNSNTLLRYVFQLSPSGVIFCEMLIRLNNIHSELGMFWGTQISSIPDVISEEAITMKVAAQITDKMKAQVADKITEEQFKAMKKRVLHFQ